jgi:hypothetical protein
MEPDALRIMLHPQRSHRIGGHRRRRRHLGKRSAVRPPEAERAAGQSLELISLLVHRAMMAATE